MANYNIDFKSFIQQLVNNAIQDAIPETAIAVSEILKQKCFSQNNPAEYLAPDEVCAKLKISRTTLWRHDKKNRIPSVTLGGKRLYRYEDVLNALKK